MSDTNVPHVYLAITEITGKLSKSGISKDRKNTQQNYSFRGIDDVYGALSPLLAEHKLCILPRVLSRSVTERETQKGGVLFYVVLDVEFDFVSAVDGSKHIVRTAGEAMDSGDKATNKAMSAAYKYACLQAFSIPTEGDNDADATTHEPVKATKISPMGDALQRVDTRILNKHVVSLNEHFARDPIDELGIKQVLEEIGNDHDMKIGVWSKLQNWQKDFIRAMTEQKPVVMPNGRAA